MTTTTRTLAATIALITTLALAACGYTLQGKVVRGDYSAIQIVDKDDPRLQNDGIPNVQIQLQTDPNRINRETIARLASTPDGTVNIPVDLPGAGMFIYDMGLYARKPGYEPAQHLFKLPSSNRRVLITLAPGEDRDLGVDRRAPDRDLERFMR